MTAATAPDRKNILPEPDTPPVMFGRFMLPDLTEHPCQVKDLTLDGAKFLSTKVPAGGVSIVAYIDDVGRVEAISAGPVPGGFQVIFSHSGARRERFAARIQWALGKDSEALAENRRHIRYETADKPSHITMPDGRVYPCEVIDISLSGAAIKVDVMPSLGTYVMLGRMRGRIVRYHETGIAIEFVKPLERTELKDELR